jgi:hypothetical protein
MVIEQIPNIWSVLCTPIRQHVTHTQDFGFVGLHQREGHLQQVRRALDQNRI